MGATIIFVGAFVFVGVVLWMLVAAGNNRRY